MTADELTELLKNGPNEKLVAALAPLTEAERKKLSKAASTLLKELTPKDVGPFFHQRKPALLRCKLTVFGVGGLAEVQRIRLWHLFSSWEDKHDHRDILFQIISDRKPSWISKWVEKEFEQRELFPDWRFIRRLVRDGICPKPDSEAYMLRCFLGSIAFADRNKTLKEILHDDPDLLNDEVWRIFELAPIRGSLIPGPDITDFTVENVQGRSTDTSWGFVLRDFSREGKLDRQRLLSASLGGIQRNSEARNTTWFAKFHEFLEPTIDERVVLQSAYLQLLTHPMSSVVDLALAALIKLDDAKRLDAAGLLDGISAVFHVQPKAQPQSAVKLLGRIVAANPALAPRIAETLIAGLVHPAPQVQEAILKLLDKLRDRASDIIAQALPAQIESLAPSLQKQAREWISATPEATPKDDSPSELLDQARVIASPWREAAGIDALLNAIETSGELPALRFDSMAVPRLNPEDRVKPVESLDELIERLTVAIEGLDDAIEFELLLDGLSRLCDQRPDDFDARVAPLVKRIKESLRVSTMSYEWFGLRLPLYRAVLRWCVDFCETDGNRDSLLGFLDLRTRLLTVRIRDQRATPLLACPTHKAGWIDPAEMLARLEWYQRNQIEPNTIDFIQSLFRLAPDGRADVLMQASTLEGKFASAFCYALGGPPPDSLVTPMVLLAAGRARDLTANLADLPNVGEAVGPDVVQPATYFWEINPHGDKIPSCPHCGKPLRTQYAQQCFECGKNWHNPNRTLDWLPDDGDMRVKVQPELRINDQLYDSPAALLHLWLIPEGYMFENAAAVVRWAGTVWPANPTPFFGAGIRLRRGQYNEANRLRMRARFLDVLFDPNVPFTEIAQVLLALSLNGQAAEVTGLAVDALVELIADGRCVGTELGDVIGRLLSSEIIKLNRLGKHLETAARASLLHAHVCAEIVQTACRTLVEVPKDLHCLLGPLLEWLSSLEQGVRSDFRPILEKATTGKAGTLAKKLLKLPSTSNKRRAVLVEALRGRVKRGERWADSFSARTTPCER